MELMRIIVGNLAFNFGESLQSRLIDELFMPEEVKKIPVSYTNVKRSIIELYAATKLEVIAVLRKSKELHRDRSRW